MIGRILNERYKIVRKVGSGGMADVYEGIDTATDKTVAIKILKEEYSNDPQYLRRLRREAQAMVSIENEHVVSLYNMGNDGDLHYLVMEYVNGETLRDYMDRVGRIEPKKAVGIICSVLDGLSQAHKNNLIHRDVKPQNIMITDSGVIKLADFGIAKFTDSSTHTYEGSEALGSVHYISPEQAKGEKVDAQTDLYSVGVMLYEMLSGEPPFSGDNAVQIALKHINDEIEPLHEKVPGISYALSDVVARATAKDRNIRYSSSDQMRSDLRHALRSPLSRFAKIRKEEHENADEADPVQQENGGKKGGLKEHLPLIAIIGAVVGVIAVFLVMFLVSMSKIDDRSSRVPNLLGFTLEDAVDYANNREFTVEVRASEPSEEYSEGEICDQDPPAQSKAEKGSVIYVTVSTGNEMRSVPYLIGMTLEEAERSLDSVELVLDSNIEYYMDNDYPAGTVIRQNVNAGETLMVGESVSITVCGDPTADMVAMPDLNSLSVEKAIEKLNELGIDYCITVGEYDLPNNTVYKQNPSGGIEVIRDMIKADIYISRNSTGVYSAQFGENVTLTNDRNDVSVVMLTSLGEVVLHRAYYPAGQVTLAFTGHYWVEGSYTCIIYVNGEVYTSFTRDFDIS